MLWEVWYQGWDLRSKYLVGFGLQAPAFTMALMYFFFHRLVHVRRLFLQGHRVQGTIEQVSPARSFRVPKVNVRCRYRVNASEYNKIFWLPKETGNSLGSKVWLRVDPIDPQRAIIEELYT